MAELKFIERKFAGLQKFSWFNVCIKPYRVLNFLRKFIPSIVNGKISEEIDRYISSNLTQKERFSIYLDILSANILYGASIVNYFTYDFYLKSGLQRKEFITEGQSRRIWYAFNPPIYRDIFREKNQTYKVFKDFIDREYLFLAEVTDFKAFEEFCHRHKEIFIKPKNASWGRGARKVRIDNSINLVDLYEECYDNQYIVEEVIVQHPDLAAFHPSSLNTIRVSTVVTKNGVKIMKPSFFKMGNHGSVNDNYSSGGLLSEIDINTGIIYTGGFDKNRNQYFSHPTSKLQIKGFRIPFWEEIRSFAQKLAYVVPQNRYVGWDIALSINGKPLLVEGNEHGDFFTFTQPGNRKMYEDALKEI
ncbi:MAG: hypothetical protein K0B06_05590 [Brevefilum sp.]|nr:hypothetical protein [Brevefilum sp.]